MLTTIEEKLSAIKAINDKKDFVETQLSMISRCENEPPLESFLKWHSANGTNQLTVPTSLMKHYLKDLEKALCEERDQLIAKATELMK